MPAGSRLVTRAAEPESVRRVSPASTSAAPRWNWLRLCPAATSRAKCHRLRSRHPTAPAHPADAKGTASVTPDGRPERDVCVRRVNLARHAPRHVRMPFAGRASEDQPEQTQRHHHTDHPAGGKQRDGQRASLPNESVNLQAIGAPGGGRAADPPPVLRSRGSPGCEESGVYGIIADKATSSLFSRHSCLRIGHPRLTRPSRNPGG
jgi:hypothetical protein